MVRGGIMIITATHLHKVVWVNWWSLTAVRYHGKPWHILFQCSLGSDSLLIDGNTCPHGAQLVHVFLLQTEDIADYPSLKSRRVFVGYTRQISCFRLKTTNCSPGSTSYSIRRININTFKWNVWLYS